MVRGSDSSRRSGRSSGRRPTPDVDGEGRDRLASLRLLGLLAVLEHGGRATHPAGGGVVVFFSWLVFGWALLAGGALVAGLRWVSGRWGS